MTDQVLEELQSWDKKICEIATNLKLDWFDIDYELCDYYEMIGAMAYVGMPVHYKHWSYGKSFERTHQMYNKGLEGLPYEMIINSNPSIAYLMRENPMSMHVLTMAHCVGHSDFFKNNVTFKNTKPDSVISRFKRAAERIDSYIKDPSIGIEKVENVLDAAHSLSFQCNHFLNIKKLSHKETREKYLKRIQEDDTGKYKDFDINKIPLEPDYDILEFIKNHGRNLDEWEKDVLEISIEHSKYFIPQARTKIMNEGFASRVHYKILNELDLPQNYHLSFLRSHNQVIRPHVGGINPYHLGFEIFKKIEEEYGWDECLKVRECHNDESFIRFYLDQDLCQKLNLFSYFLKKTKQDEEYIVSDISDDESWRQVKEDLLKSVALNSVPKVFVESVDKKDYSMTLKHEFDGRELNLDYANKVVKHIKVLWRDPVKFFTVIEEEPWEI